jgi:polygalacturonase
MAGMGAAVPALVAAPGALANAPSRARTAGQRGVLDVTRFGATGDGKTSCTAAIQKAIDACGAAGGGTVLVPPGSYLTGALFLRSHVQLELAAGSTLLASARHEDFPPIKGRDEGVERTVHASLLTGVDLEDVAITGLGTLDGRGEPWVRAYQKTLDMRVAAHLVREAENPDGAPLKWPRPRLINLVRCRDVLVAGVTLANTPFYGIHLVYCEDVVVDGVTNRHLLENHSTGIVVDSSKRVLISRCQLSRGGDGIGIKAGYNEDGRRVGLATEDILIASCHMFHIGATAIAIGSETSGSIRNVTITDCVIHETANGLHVRAPRGRGGVVERLRMSNVVMDGVSHTALKISHFFDSVGMSSIKGDPNRRNLELARSRHAPVDIGTPTFQDFVFSGLTIARTEELGLVEGLPERFIRGLAFQDITAAETRGGLSLCMAADVTISNFTTGTLESAAVDAREVQGLEVHRLRSQRPYAGAPAIWLENVSDALIHGCHVADPGPPYQWIRQEQSHAVALVGNHAPVRDPGP